MIHVFLISLMLFWTQSPNSSLTLIVRDEADQPVPGLTLSLTDADGTRQSATTDATGRASFTGLPSVSITLTAATTAAGQPLVLDPTTPRDGMVLGLIPGATRVVPLRLVNGLLFLDPLEVFAGTDESADAIPAPAAVAPSIGGVPTIAPDRSGELGTSSVGRASVVIPASIWCIGGLVAVLGALGALLVFGRVFVSRMR